MWHEARKQERIIRGLIVDYRRRAERRRDFYEKIKAEPHQFLQLHGRPCKIHLDPAVAAAGDSPAIMMPWQGDTHNMIDRFDARAHLDHIAEVKNPEISPEDLAQEERQCNYERYRILAQNAFLGISEDKFLHQLAIEEQYGVTLEEKEAQKSKNSEKKGGVAIGYNYNDPGAQPSTSTGPELKADSKQNKGSDDESDFEIIDVDLSIDVNKMEPLQAHELNAVGPHFGMAGVDLFSFMTGDADDAEHQKQLMREEKEKAMYSGRKSRRERRAHRDKKQATRVISPPRYAAPTDVTSGARSRSQSKSKSRSATPENAGKIEFITSFGGDEPEITPSLPKVSYSDKLKHNLRKDPSYSEVVRKPRQRTRSSSYEDKLVRYPKMGPHRPKSRTLSDSRSRSKSRSRSVSRSRSRSRSYSRSRSRSRRRSYSRSPYRSSRSRSRSYSPSYRRSRSRSNHRSWRSRSPSNNVKSNATQSQSNDKPSVPRYYGRKKNEDKSSSELSIDSDSSTGSDDKNNDSAVGNKSNSIQKRFTGSSSKVPSRETLTLKEKLKRKMQAQLSRQLKADKRAEAERLERESRRQARREEEMREMAIKLRRKQREMRHQQTRRSSDDSDNSQSDSSSDSASRDSKRTRSNRSKSKSSSPRPVPVWETNREPFSYSEQTNRYSRYETGESSQQNRRYETQPFRNREEPQPSRHREEPQPFRNREEPQPFRNHEEPQLGERTEPRFRNFEQRHDSFNNRPRDSNLEVRQDFRARNADFTEDRYRRENNEGRRFYRENEGRSQYKSETSHSRPVSAYNRGGYSRTNYTNNEEGTSQYPPKDDRDKKIKLVDY